MLKEIKRKILTIQAPRTAPANKVTHFHRLSALVLMLGIITAGFTGCFTDRSRPSFDIESIKTYRDIPGITEKEINEIEALKSARNYFSYGAQYSTEAFISYDGEYTGFTAMFCRLLSDIFGIPFIQDFYEWDSLFSGFRNTSIDFTGELTPTLERRTIYHMTSPIAERSLIVLFMRGDSYIEKAYDLNGLKIGFLSGTITERSVREIYRSLSFETIDIQNENEAVEKLLSGEINAFVIDSPSVFSFRDNDLMTAKNVLPLVYTPVSMSTANPELEPVISVVNKYLVAGGVNIVNDLYKASSREYATFDFTHSLTNEEREYVADLLKSGFKIPIALDHDNYPVCFFNENDNEYQGIAPDILTEISLLTGIEFEIKTINDTPWYKMFEMLETGEVTLVSALRYAEEREENYIWASEPYLHSNFAFISKYDYPNLDFYQIPHVKVGLPRGTIFENLYKSWFHGYAEPILYDTRINALDALGRGEIDMMLSSDYTLLYQTHYRGEPGYKINVSYKAETDGVFFGFNKYHEIIASIISKAQGFADTEMIARGWTERVYDYSKTIAEQRSFFLTVLVFVFAVLLGFLSILFIMNNKTRALYKAALERTKLMFESAPLGCNLWNEDINQIDANMEVVKLFGVKDKQEYLDRFFELSPEYQPDGSPTKEYAHRHIKIAFRDGYCQFEYMHQKLDGTPIPTEVKLIRIQTGRGFIVAGYIRDLREQKQMMKEIDHQNKQLEEAIKVANEASKAKSNFLATISHEIRTPMNAIIGMTELALREDMSDIAREHTITVKQAGVNLLAIINDILDFSKIESGNMQIVPAEYLLSSLINDVISIIRMKAVDSQIRFVVFLDSNLPNALIGDEARIRQVLINILGNAVKYTDKGYVSFSINGELTDDSAIKLSMEVKDSGRGIKQEYLEKLFQVYTQFDVESNRNKEGIGLGLAISRSIMRAMDGDITVQSKYREGSTFTVTFPQKIQTYERIAVVGNPDKKATIVYDRRETYAKSIVRTLTNLDIKYELTSSDEQFCEMIAKDSFAYIFISYPLFVKNRNTILNYGSDSQIVLLTEFGESIPTGNWSVLSMPIHAISAANVFNGVSDRFSYDAGKELTVRMIAPEANVLIVDDINTNLKVANGLLLPYKMNVDLCNSGKEAIEAVKAKRYDIVFMDHRMPDMDGVETTERIRAMGSEDRYYRDLPIIALTANAVAGMKEMFLENGFDDFLTKPIDTVRLNSVLEKWIQKNKQTGSTIVNSKDTNKPDPLLSSIEIEGVDINKGLLLSGGTTNYYFEILATFLDDWSMKTKEIIKSLETENLPLYTTYVHALKSAAANIGADKLSEAAYALEKAGRQGDLAFITAGNDDTLLMLARLLKNINAALSSRGINKADVSLETEKLKSELNILKSALQTFDFEIINRAVDTLSVLEQTDSDRVEIRKISRHILMSEYDEAEALIDSLLSSNL